MPDPGPPGQPRSKGLLMFLLLLLVLALFVSWAFVRNPPGSPNSTATGAPTDGTAGATKRTGP